MLYQRNNPTRVLAAQWNETTESLLKIRSFCEASPRDATGILGTLSVKTHKNEKCVWKNDFVLVDENGYVSSCTPEKFKKNYTVKTESKDDPEGSVAVILTRNNVDSLINALRFESEQYNNLQEGHELIVDILQDALDAE